MIKTALLACGVAFALVAAPVAFADNEPTTASATAADKDPVICKKQDETGSRLGGKKICKTKSEWAQDAEQTKTEMRGIDMHGGSSGHTPGG